MSPMQPANDNGRKPRWQPVRSAAEIAAASLPLHPHVPPRANISRTHANFLDADRTSVFHPGYVYVVGFDAYVKIGFTRNFVSRFDGLQGGVPTELFTLEVFLGDKRDEARLMGHFSDCSTGYGEWFHLTGRLEAWIRAGLPYSEFELATGRRAAA